MAQDELDENPLGQFLTAVFELAVTKRKAAALERVRASSETAFWAVLGRMRPQAEAVAALKDKDERKKGLAQISSSVLKLLSADAVRLGLNEPVVQGLLRDISGSIASFVELRAGGHEAEWPERSRAYEADLSLALDMLAASTDKRAEDEARDLAAKISRGPLPRPFILTRGRDGLIIRNGANGRLAAILNVLPVTKTSTRVTKINAGFDAATGEKILAGKSKAKIAIPLRCSKWHEHKFLSGNTRLGSSLIFRRGDRWFMAAQFDMPKKKRKLTDNRLGVDRGIVNPISIAVVGRDGRVVRSCEPAGAEIGDIIKKTDAKRRAEQKRRETTSHKHVGRINNELHVLANHVVREAKIHGAAVVFEDLTGLKSVIVTKKKRGARKNPWQKVLKSAQLGKLEGIIAYKLKAEGLPAPIEVLAGGTSQTCPACGHRDHKNRTSQAAFVCTSCGFSQHADKVAPVNIARRGIVLKQIKRGEKLLPREQNMVAQLRLRDDSGLGPLVAAYSGTNGPFVAVYSATNGLVADRATADTAYDPTPGLTVTAGQNSSPSAQNELPFVFPEGSALNSKAHNRQQSRSGSGRWP